MKALNVVMAFVIALMIYGVVYFNGEVVRTENRTDAITKRMQDAGMLGGGLNVRQNKRQ